MKMYLNIQGLVLQENGAGWQGVKIILNNQFNKCVYFGPLLAGTLPPIMTTNFCCYDYEIHLFPSCERPAL